MICLPPQECFSPGWIFKKKKKIVNIHFSCLLWAFRASGVVGSDGYSVFIGMYHIVHFVHS